VDLPSDLDPQLPDIGVGAEHRGRAARGQLGLAGDEESKLGENGFYPSLGLRFGLVDGRQGPQPAPEHLGEQVVLRGEVGVGGGGTDLGAAGDVPDAEVLVTGLAYL